MSKIGPKEIQQRALQEARLEGSRGSPSVDRQPPGLQRDSVVRSGHSTPAIGEPTPDSRVKPKPRETKFDRITYQREYMRKWRKRQADQRAKEKQ